MNLFSLNEKDIGIDLGTANTIVMVKGKGIVINEPSVIAIQKETNKIMGFGNEAKEMLGKTPEQINAIRPLKDGVIADFKATQQMLKIIISKIINKYRIGKPRVIIGIPSGITEVEERALKEVAVLAGAREAFLVEEPLLAATGAKLDLSEPSGNMIVDIGGGTVEIAVTSLGGIVVSTSIKTAGDELTQAIINYVKREMGILIGENMAEKAKIELGCAQQMPSEKSIIIKGRDLNTGLPRKAQITDTQVMQAIEKVIDDIVDAIKSTLEKTPPELASDIVEKGIVICGGGALISGIDKKISQRTQIQVFIAEDPLECVIKGIGKSLDDIDKIKNILRGTQRQQ